MRRYDGERRQSRFNLTIPNCSVMGFDRSWNSVPKLLCVDSVHTFSSYVPVSGFRSSSTFEGGVCRSFFGSCASRNFRSAQSMAVSTSGLKICSFGGSVEKPGDSILSIGFVWRYFIGCGSRSGPFSKAIVSGSPPSRRFFESRTRRSELRWRGRFPATPFS